MLLHLLHQLYLVLNLIIGTDYIMCDVNIYAIYSILYYNLKLMTQKSFTNLTYGQSATPPRTGHTFSHWTVSYITGNVTKAVFNINIIYGTGQRDKW